MMSNFLSLADFLMIKTIIHQDIKGFFLARDRPVQSVSKGRTHTIDVSPGGLLGKN